MNCCAPSAVISGLKYRWRPVTRLRSGPIKFKTFITDLNDRTEYTLREFAEGLVDAPNGCAAIQKSVDSLDKWTNENLWDMASPVPKDKYSIPDWYTLPV